MSINFEANWMEARSFCKTFDNMDLASFDSSYEWSNFLKRANSQRAFFDKWTHVGKLIFKFIEKGIFLNIQ